MDVVSVHITPPITKMCILCTIKKDDSNKDKFKHDDVPKNLIVW
jgi:hypothetical protein